MRIVIKSTDNPTPELRWDWCAYDDNTLDIGSLLGLGSSPKAAFEDFLDQHEEKHGIRPEDKFESAEFRPRSL
jgi:hypothetical protein